MGLDRDERYELIRQAARDLSVQQDRSVEIPPEYIGLAHYTERQIRQYAKDIGLTERYIETIGKERES